MEWTILRRFLIELCLVGTVAPALALAYIDPVAGSVMPQVLIAGAFGASRSQNKSLRRSG